MGNDCTGIGLLERAVRDRQETDLQPPNDQFSRSGRELLGKAGPHQKQKLYSIQLNKANIETRQLRPETETVHHQTQPQPPKS